MIRKKKGTNDTEVSIEEQERIAGLLNEGLLLVDAALGYGHEGRCFSSLFYLLFIIIYLFIHLFIYLLR